MATLEDTPASLRLKAADLMELAEQSRAPRIAAELRSLAAYFLDRASRLERAVEELERAVQRTRRIA